MPAVKIALSKPVYSIEKDEWIIILKIHCHTPNGSRTEQYMTLIWRCDFCCGF